LLDNASIVCYYYYYYYSTNVGLLSLVFWNQVGLILPRVNRWNLWSNLFTGCPHAALPAIQTFWSTV